VARTFSYEDKSVVSVRYGVAGDDTGSYSQYATGNHPFWVKGTGWTRADLLEPGHELELQDGRQAFVLEVVPVYKTSRPNVGWEPEYPHRVVGFEADYSQGWEWIADGAREPAARRSNDPFLTTKVYNIEVEDFHTYYVGELGVWVHNANCASIDLTARALPRLAAMLLIGAAALSSPALAYNALVSVQPGRIFTSLDAFQKALAGGEDEMTSLVAGELTGIGEVQAAIIRHRHPAAGLQVVLIARRTDGQMIVQALSKTVSASDIEASVRIERGSLFIRMDSTTGGAWGTYQYKHQVDGRLRLIGIKLHRADNSGEPDHDTTAVVDTDFNLATGKMLFKRMGDTRPAEAVARGPACYLEDFAFDLYSCAASMRTADETPAERLMNTP
jgi:hypothetical protein